MLMELKRQVWLSRKGYVTGLCISLGVALLATLVMVLVAPITEDKLANAGSIALLIAAGFYSLSWMLGRSGYVFDLCLKAGATRRQFFLMNMVQGVAFTFLLGLLAYLWTFVDRAASALVGLPMPHVFTPSPLILLLAVVGICLMGNWSGALLQRYGRKGFFVVWGLWMAVMLGGSQVGAALSDPERHDLIARIIRVVAGLVAKLPVGGLTIVAILAALAIGLHSWWMMSRTTAQA